jgi:flagellar biosynthesis/type III secretory pathway M-ring protein FliF/YscJ
MTLVRSRFAFLVASLMALVGGGVFVCSPAQADTFEYWSLWEVKSGAWEAAQVGASGLKVQDESVVGVKYVQTKSTPTQTDAPSQSASYAKLCSAGTTADEVNVAVVIDYGEPDLNPSEEATPQPAIECLSVSSPATAASALSAAATVTAKSDGFITQINSYPAAESTSAATAGPATADPAAEKSAPGLSLIWLVLIVGFVILVIAVAVALYRRNRQSSKDWEEESPQ